MSENALQIMFIGAVIDEFYNFQVWGPHLAEKNACFRFYSAIMMFKSFKFFEVKDILLLHIYMTKDSRETYFKSHKGDVSRKGLSHGVTPRVN